MADSIIVDGVTYSVNNAHQLSGVESFVKALQGDAFNVTPSQWVCYTEMPQVRDEHTVVSIGDYYWQGPSASVNDFLVGFQLVSQNYPTTNIQAVRISNAVVDSVSARRVDSVSVRQANEMMIVNTIKTDSFMNAVRRADVSEVKKLLAMQPISINSAVSLAMRRYNKQRSRTIVHILVDSGKVMFERLLNAIATAAAERRSVTQAEAIELVQRVITKVPVDRDVYEVMLRFEKLGWTHLMKVIAALVR